ncbi:MAG: hypothetical protein AAGD35_16050 [Actinomycetota bacterium]
MATLLKALLQEQHLQTYDLFRVEFQRVAEAIDSPAVAPSRTQFRRWLTGDLQSLPHARSCRVLVQMFPDYSAAELFDPPGVVNGERRSQAAADAPNDDDPRIIDAHTEIEIDIDAEGHAIVRYCYDMLNLTDGPVARVPRTIWFKHTHADVTIEPIQLGERQVRIELQHDVMPQKKFAYRISPAIEPGGRARFGCEISGGAFVDDFFWRHLALRSTDLMTISVVHRGRTLDEVTAHEEQTNGSEILVSDNVEWSQDGPDLRLRLQRKGLEPTQVVTLRWEISQP